MVRRFVGATFSAGSSTSTTELRRDRVGVLAPDTFMGTIRLRQWPNDECLAGFRWPILWLRCLS
jgi:hypothetical protein